MFSTTVVNLSEILQAKLDKQYEFLKEMLFIIFYYSRPLPEEMWEMANKSANDRFKTILNKVEKRPSPEKQISKGGLNDAKHS